MTYGWRVADRPLEPLYLLTGSDVPKVERALRRLRGRFSEGSIDWFTADACSAEDAIGAANALGLFGGGERLVIVEGVERWKKADIEAIGHYALDPSPGSVLALVADAKSIPDGLEQAVGGTGGSRILRYDIPGRQRGRKDVPDYVLWVRQQFEAAGSMVEHDAAERLVELVGEDVLALGNEVDKIVSWAAGGPVGTRDVEALTLPEAETTIWALVDSWGARDTGGALAACETLLQLGDRPQGQRPRRADGSERTGRRQASEPFELLARLAGHIGSVLRVHGLLEDDLGAREVATRLGLHEFAARKQAGQAGNFTRIELSDALVRMADLDFRIKGGSRVDPELELERAIVDVTARHRPEH